MDKIKLTVRIPRNLVEKVKRYAAQNRTTLTNLIEAYLQRIPDEGNSIEAPIVQRLSGILSDQESVEDYHKHLEEKYGR